MKLNRQLVRRASIFVPLAMFLAIPLFGIWSSRFFWFYIICCVIVAVVLAELKFRVDGTLTY